MSISIVMPQLGLTMTEGTLSGWLKKPGEYVKKNEPLLTIETDKAEMEVESLVEGTLGEIIVQPGNTVPVGTVLAYIIGDESQATSAEPEKPAPQSAPEEPAKKAAAPPASVVTKPEKKAGQKPVSPRAKRLAQELGVDVSALTGTGAAGEIVEEDIRKAAGQSGGKTRTAGPNLRRRQIIAERLVHSIQTIPTFSVSAEANAENLIALHQSLKVSDSTQAAKVTITDLLLKLFGTALKNSPDVSSTWENNGPKNNASVDIGLAVATPEGVIAPVLKGVDALEFPKLIAKRHDLTERARAGKLALTDLEGGISTLSNLGMYRVDQFEALIAPGQSSILAVGKIRNRPWAEGDKLVAKPTVILNLTVDHRIADGAAAATFLGKLVEAIEDPSRSSLQTVTSSNGSGRGSNA